MSKLIDPIDLIESVIESAEWDLGALELRQNSLDLCPNAIAWMLESKYGGFQPFPRQIQFAAQLFEDYCPFCSNLDVVEDMWGMTPSEIQKQVVFLQHGVCPVCGQNKNHFRDSKLHKGRHELIGIAGQRCLDPSTEVIVKTNDNLVKTTLSCIRPGDWIADKKMTLTKVKKVSKSIQAGYFKVVCKYQDRITEFKCGHEHIWVTSKGDVPVTVLTTQHKLLDYQGKLVEILEIERIKIAYNMIDIETATGTFVHSSGILLHNSGKTFIVGVFSSYLTHRYLCLDGVCSNHYKGMRNTLIMATFVASDKSQVEETTWGNYRMEIKKSVWYQQYFEYLNSESKRLGVKLLHFKDTFMFFPAKRLLASFAAGNFASLRGRTRNIGSIDEVGWLESRSTAKRSNAKEIYAALNNSLRTIRSGAENMYLEGKFNLPTAYMFNVSSPSAEDDPIMTLAANSKRDPQVLIFHYPTWEIRPDITREALRGEFEKDPLGAQRDFGAEPSTNRHVFLSNIEILDASIEDRSNCINYEITEFVQSIKEKNYHYVKASIQNVQATKTVPYCVAIDAGETGNSFGIVISSLDLEEKTVFNGAIMIAPRALLSGSIASVHFPSALDLIKELRKLIPIEMVVIDRWQSTSFVHELRDLGLQAFRYSLKYNDFRNFKSRYIERKIKYPSPEISFRLLMLERLTDMMPVSVLLKQTRTVRDTGKQVTKPSNGDDDLFRCSVLADWAMQFYKPQFLRRAIGGSRVSTSFGVQRETRTSVYKSALDKKYEKQKSQIGGSLVQTKKRR